MAAAAFAAFAQTRSPATFTAEQAARGEATFMLECAACHGEGLDNGEFAPPLAGGEFRSRWAGQGLDAPFAVMTGQMPPSNPGGLGASVYSDVLAFILQRNGVAASDRALPADAHALAGLSLPTPAARKQD